MLDRVGITSLDEDLIYTIYKRHRALGICEFSDFNTIIRNYWPTVKINKYKKMTIRTAYKSNEVPKENPFEYDIDRTVEIEGRVGDDSNISYCPMSFLVNTCSGKYTVASYLFVYQYSVRRGNYVRVKGNLRRGLNFITIDLRQHGIKILD